MKITDIQSTVLSVLHLTLIIFSQGISFGTTHTIKPSQTKNLVGIGEISGAAPKNVIDKVLRPILIISDPFQLEKPFAR